MGLEWVWRVQLRKCRMQHHMEKYQSHLSRWAQYLSSPPLPVCSTPPLNQGTFQPKGQGWAVHLLDSELHLVSSGQNAKPTLTFQDLHSSVAGLWGPMNYKKGFIVCSLGRP